MKVLIITSEEIDTSAFNAEFRFIDWNCANFALDINFSDYDGLVIDVDSLAKEKEKKGEDDKIYLSNFEQQLSPEVTNDILGRKGSFVTIIGNPATLLQYSSLINLLGFNASVKQLKGTNITDRCDNNNFKNYWKKINEYHYYFEWIKVNRMNNNPFRGCRLKVYDEIKNRSGYIIGTCISPVENLTSCPVLSGEISFVPPLEDKQETIRNILEIYLPFGDEKEPGWAQSLMVVGQKAIEDRISELATKINGLLQQKQDLEEDRQNLRRCLEVLYKSDKLLEKSTKQLLKEIGFTNSEPGESNKVEFYVNFKNYNFVVEVKSTKKESLDMKGLRQVINWQMDKMSESNEKYKALLITSNQYNLPLEKRSRTILPSNLIEFAKQYEICVLPVTILFYISQLISEKKYTVKEFADLLYKTNGIVKMPKV